MRALGLWALVSAAISCGGTVIGDLAEATNPGKDRANRDGSATAGGTAGLESAGGSGHARRHGPRSEFQWPHAANSPATENQEGSASLLAASRRLGGRPVNSDPPELCHALEIAVE
jgi:hypothetical protein